MSRSEALPEPGGEVTYDWPDGGERPSAPRPRDAVGVGRREEVRTDLGRRGSARLRQLGSGLRAPCADGLPSIQIAERLAVVERGRVLREWPETGLLWTGHPPTPPVSDPYQHHVPGGVSSGTYSVLDGRGSQRGRDDSWISHEHDSCTAALVDAGTWTDRRALVVRLLTTKDWH